MKRIAAFLWAGIVLSIFGCVGVMLFATNAKAQDRPITSWPTDWVGVVVHATPTGGCIAGWRRGTKDKYEPYYMQRAMLDSSRLSAEAVVRVTTGISNKSMANLASERTVSLGDPFDMERDPSIGPCIDKLQAPPLTWVVAPDADGLRPAYCLNQDGTKGVRCGDAETFIPGTTAAMPCQVWKARVVGVSTYGTWPTAKKTFDPAEKVRVTLCREVK